MIGTLVAISGLSSEVGKTTLLCDLLREFPGWEAIKMTRGHYRSCGKDPHACCVSHLLSDAPVIRSGYEQTYACGKDTGRYWEAGASNVHWVIVTDGQVEQGIRLALDRVIAPGVLIEGNSFLRFIDVDFAVIVARGRDGKVKSSTRWAFQKASAFYLFDRDESLSASDNIIRLKQRLVHTGFDQTLPVYTSKEFSHMVTRIRHIHSACTEAC
jgi:hypothetical protein